jgi:hypothetical protein
MSVRLDEIRLAGSWDRWGVAASILCVVHCIATPFAAMLVPVLATVESLTHGALAIAVALFALLALVPGTRTHGRRPVVLLGLSGLVLIWGALLLPESSVADAVREGMTVSGGLTMVAAHLCNVVCCVRCAAAPRGTREARRASGLTSG